MFNKIVDNMPLINIVYAYLCPFIRVCKYCTFSPTNGRPQMVH